MTGSFKSDFYHKFLGENPLKREEDTNNDILVFNSHLKYIDFNAIMYCDLDNFKMINELINYSTGDLILQNFTKTINEFSNKLMIIRKGGDEFIILGNISIINELSDYIISDEFLTKLNYNIDSLNNNPNQITSFSFKEKTINIQTSISFGISIIENSLNFKDKNDFILFNQNFRNSLNDAEKKLKLHKQQKMFFYRIFNN